MTGEITRPSREYLTKHYADAWLNAGSARMNVEQH